MVGVLQEEEPLELARAKMTKMESPLARSSRAAAEKSGWTQWNEWLAGSKDEEKREVMRPLLREHIRGRSTFWVDIILAFARPRYV